MEIKTKYNIGDAVYILDGYKIVRANISCIKVEKHGDSKASILYYFPIFPMRKESECFSTREELIKFLNK